MGIFEMAKQVMNEEPIPAMLRKQASITKLFPQFYDRVKGVGAAGGIHLVDEDPGLWSFEVASATTPGKHYDIHVEFRDIVNQIQRLAKNRQLWNKEETHIDLRKLAAEMMEDADVKIDCSCPAFQYWGPAYITTKRKSKYGDQENRPPNVRNPKQYGLGCKHSQLMFDVLPFYKGTMAGHLKRFFKKEIIKAELASQKEMGGIKKGAEFLAKKQEENPKAKPEQKPPEKGPKKESVMEAATPQDKEEHFKSRTQMHIDLVKQAAARIKQAKVLSDEDGDKMIAQVEKHDASKFEEPERTPYVELSWRKKMGETGTTPEINVATMHHITTNPHHPEYHLADKSQANLSKENRDESDFVVDATAMPDIDIAEMVADWHAMSEELKTNTAREWFDKQKDVRWHFSDEQVELIDKLLTALETREPAHSLDMHDGADEDDGW